MSRDWHVLEALGIPDRRIVEAVRLGMRTERLTIEPGGLSVVVRTGLGNDQHANELAVIEALSRAGFSRMPRVLAALPDGLIEEWIDATTALAVVPPPGSLEAGVRLLAEIHASPVREGLLWGGAPEILLTDEELPLHRLGFASHERDAARPPLAAIRRTLLAGPFGFAHRAATADHVLLSEGQAWLTGFDRAGFGHQLIDVAAFLATSGAETDERKALVGTYHQIRTLDGGMSMRDVQAATIWWGLEWLLDLPRRMIGALGDDIAIERLRLMAARTERAIKEPWSGNPDADRLRAALWPRG